MSEYNRKRKGLYRSRQGFIFGVCRGVADYLDISVFWTRAIAVFFLFVSFGWAVFGYVVAALLMKLEPVIPLESADDAEFYNSYASSHSLGLRRLKQTYDRLNRRIERLETIVTGRDYDWEQRLKS